MSIFSVGGSTPSDDAVESKSVRFEDGDSAYLSWTPTIEGNRKTYTLSCWVKRGELTTSQCIFSASGGGGVDDGIQFHSDDTLRFFCNSGNADYKTTAQYRDPAAWYHIVMAIDTTLATAGDRMRLYVNGEEVTDFSTESAPSQNADNLINDNVTHRFGSWSSSAGAYFSGYIAEAYFIDGKQCLPAEFGETDSDTNQWKPKAAADIKPTVTFGTNGFYLPFSNDALAASFTDSAEGYGTPHTFTPTEELTCDVLLVGGGGAGGVYHAGGGGAGGVIVGTGWTVPASAQDVWVGGGGQSYTGWPSTPGTISENGGNSKFLDQVAYGGGGGGSYAATSGANPASAGIAGGSGGGAAGGHYGGTAWDLSGGIATKGLLTLPGTAHGFAGGLARPGSTHAAGGGGGAGEVGENETYPAAAGDGGDGIQNDYRTGSNVYYGGGGGGGQWAGSAAGTGGQGGGGAGEGGVNTGNGGDGTANTGGGGGGFGGNSNSYRGGHGGSGIVVIRYASATAKASGGTITSYTSGPTTYQVHSFTTANSHEEYDVTENGDMENVRISNHTFAAKGNAHIIGPKIGSSAIAFDGTGDDLSVAQSSDFAPGTSDFTIEGWVYPISGTYAVILTDTCDQAASPPRAGIRFWVAANGIIEFYASTVNSSTDTISYNSPVGAVQLYKWQHLAAVRDGNIFRAYVDGVQVSTLTITATSNSIPAPGPLLLGRQVSNYANMNVDEYRFSNTCRYPNGTTFTPPTSEFTSDANTKLLIHSNTTMGSTTFTDSSSAGHTITANGNVQHVAPKIGTGMASFDGSGDYLSTDDTAIEADWDFGTTDFTLEMWVCFNSIGGSNEALIANHAGGGNGWQWIYDANHFELWSTDQSEYQSGTIALSTDTWYHVAVCRDGDTLRHYVDGTQQGTNGFTETMNSLGTPLVISSYNSSGSGSIDGYMDEIRISKICRYPNGTTFTPSTTAFKDDKDTVLLMHMDGGGGIDPETNLPTLVGQGTYFWDASNNAIFYDAAGVPTNKSMVNFPGNGYLTVPSSTDFEFGTGDFTIECWMNLTKDQTNRSLYTQSTSGNQNGAQIEFHDATETIKYYDYGLESNWNDYASSNDAIPYGKWIHFALVRNSTAFTMYINGVAQTATGNTSSNAVHAPTGPQWGFHRSDAGRYLDDVYLDQMRISNNARYTSNFTPPTTPFTNDINTKSLIQSNFSEGGLGADHSGNYNYFTPTNMGVDDMMPDSLMNNFATLNPLVKQYSAGTFQEGNLKTTTTADAQWAVTIPVKSGKWYLEFCPGTSNGGFGVVGDNCSRQWNGAQYPQDAGSHIFYWYDGNKNIDGSVSSYGSTFTNGDIIGMALNLDDSEVTFYKNNTVQNSGTAISFSGNVTSANLLVPGGVGSSGTLNINAGQDSSFAGRKTAQGNMDDNDKGDFYYTPPSGYLALCSDNLPAPSIADPTAHFNTILYTGNGGTQALTGVGFAPNFFWNKNRTGTYQHMLYNTISGATKYLSSGETDAEATDANSLTSFDSDGVTLGSSGSSNATGVTSVGWNWKGSDTPTKTFLVTITNPGSGNRYTLEGRVSGTNAVPITIEEGGTYTFDQSHASNSGHPLRFSTTSDGTHGGGTEYTTGVTTSGTPGSAGAKTVITVASGAATLYYYCSNHSGMGAQASTPGSGGGVSDFSGTIPSVISANTTAGFSIVSYTGQAATGTIGHSLSQAPELIILKNRDQSVFWAGYVEALGNTKSISINDAGAAYSEKTWNDTTPTASVFSVGAQSETSSGRFNVAGEDFIAYCFHSVEGYSKIGGYEGNANVDGPFVYTGFKPAMVIVKCGDASSSWDIVDNKRDPYNGVTERLYPNNSDPEETASPPVVDFCSNGFKVRTTSGNWNNSSSHTQIYIAIAESPFKTSNAR